MNGPRRPSRGTTSDDSRRPSRRSRAGRLPGARVALLKVALLGSVRDLARVILRLGADDAPLPGGTLAGWRVHVDYCGG